MEAFNRIYENRDEEPLLREGPHKKWDMDTESTELEGSRLKDIEWEDLEEDEDNGNGKKQRVEVCLNLVFLHLITRSINTEKDTRE
ncbi:unnamed protein product [Lactuca saligna]|uniref:Uncharacterized protein n=1 Tax=Lactuca saligna TaxID=75948 RepID=A0AA35W020_LACSI|nr:unnamed protein product [Lactuca saligna]